MAIRYHVVALLGSIALATLALCAAAYGQTSASPTAGLAGEYAGMASGFHVKLHLTAAPDGTLAGTVDSPDFHLFALPCSDIHVNGKTLSFNVPNVQGSWLGFISDDGNKLSGTWNQGQSVPLNFARVGTSDSAVPLATSPTPPTTTTSSGAPACPAVSMANYWDGTSWKPLTLAVDLGAKRDFSLKEAMKNPMSNSAGNTLIKRYKGTAAVINLGPSPKFCFHISINEAPQVIIGGLEVKNGDREIEFKNSDRKNYKGPIPARKAFELDVVRVSDTSFEATPKDKLPPGQYVINNMSFMNYDFGVQP